MGDINSPKPVVKATVGRIVRYVPEAGSFEANNHVKDVPAIVVNDFGGSTDNLINLKVFTDGPVDTWVPSVHYSETKEPRTWHWPTF